MKFIETSEGNLYVKNNDNTLQLVIRKVKRPTLKHNTRLKPELEPGPPNLAQYKAAAFFCPVECFYEGHCERPTNWF